MTIEEIRKLRKAEETKTLRNPNNMLVTDEVDQRNIYCLAWYIYFLMAKNIEKVGGEVLYKEEDEQTANRIKQTNPFLKGLTGAGTKNDPYIIETTFGKGEFYDASALIKIEMLKKIEKGFCFNNSYRMSMGLAKNGYKCEQLSGIGFITKPFLHSVICYKHKKDGKKYILDLNYDLIMCYDFYVKLFSFEVLAKTNGKTIYEDLCEIMRACKKFEYTASDYELAFAYEETMQKIKKQLGIIGGDGTGVPPSGV